ncbi:hypothetical protein [Bradymonas sediminis]|uniref:Uncharacterized protein n=1 Tax=Bradymonas sediminis TaxID=1548548 RepID=A0A2Z4FL93_9DELT|nr:hypothetical protein [Bradymonas sediminis]AWV89777.1 hypothetical protein DN745_10680 [Bradymonas sediminis]TDP76478.1 hypothetical protein DFR33_102107 [Bradymonas sediminis]
MNYPQLKDHWTPYILTMGDNYKRLNLDLDLGKAPVQLRVEDEENAEFCSILNRGNQLAFGGPKDMGMPLWVMLDCAILPSAMAGFMLPREYVPTELLQDLGVDDDYDGYVPISEYCACPTLEPGTFSGFSLHSHITGHGLATRTKAFALAVLGAKRQIGVTQFDNPAIRVHVRFGAMEIKIHRPIIHTHSEDSFVYQLDVPEIGELMKIARGEVEFGPVEIPKGQRWSFLHDDELAHGRLREHLANGGRAWLIPPGWRATERGFKIYMVLGE